MRCRLLIQCRLWRWGWGLFGFYRFLCMRRNRQRDKQEGGARNCALCSCWQTAHPKNPNNHRYEVTRLRVPLNSHNEFPFWKAFDSVSVTRERLGF